MSSLTNTGAHRSSTPPTPADEELQPGPKTRLRLVIYAVQAVATIASAVGAIAAAVEAISRVL